MLVTDVWLGVARLPRQLNWIVLQIFVLSAIGLTLYTVSALQE